LSRIPYRVLPVGYGDDWQLVVKGNRNPGEAFL